MTLARKLRCVGLSAAVAVGCVLAAPARGVLIYTDRTAWENDVATSISTETFSSFTVDTEFVSAPLQLNGFTLQAGDLPGQNLVDVPPYQLGGIDGPTARADNILGITFAFDRPVTAWGADYAGLGTNAVNDFTITLTDSTTRAFDAPNGFSSGFLGVILDPGEFAASLVYTTTNAPAPGTPDPGDDHFFDNVSLASIPEPASTLGFAGVAAVLGSHTRRRP